MNAFTEQQLVERGFVKSADGNWSKPNGGTVDKRNASKQAPQYGQKRLLTPKPMRDSTKDAKSDSRGDSTIEGRASVLDDPRRDMNKLEASFADVLDSRKANGEIALWKYESIKFILADRTTYTPDFFVMLPDGRIEFYETKGFMRDDANVKLKVAASMFCMFRFYLVKYDKKQWKITKVGKSSKD